MSENDAKEPAPPERKVFRMTVMVPGEDTRYDLRYEVSDIQLEDTPSDVDIPDNIISRMASSLQEQRKKVMWGTCEVPECDRPNQKNRKKCYPHIWEEQRDANTDASAQHPPAL